MDARVKPADDKKRKGSASSARMTVGGVARVLPVHDSKRVDHPSRWNTMTERNFSGRFSSSSGPWAELALKNSESPGSR